MIRSLLGLLAGLLLALGVAAAGLAQEQPVTDFSRWDTLAARAEALTESGDATDQTLQALRSSIADYRSQFDAARSANDGRITALREQIAALGPAPEGEGAEPEPPEIAAQRTELNNQLNTLLAPNQRADSAFVRAEGLVREIDTILRERQTQALLAVSPSPLNPANWPTALADLRMSLGHIAADARTAVDSRSTADLRQSLPVAGVLAVVGLILILRGRPWAGLIVDRIRRVGPRALSVWRFLISLLRIALPLAGLVALTAAGILTELAGQSGNQILRLLPVLGGIVLGFRWVSERVFSRDDDEALLLVSRPERKRARFYVSIITVVIVIGAILMAILRQQDVSPATIPVTMFPLFVLISFALFCLGNILRNYTETSSAEVEGAVERVSTLSRVVRSLGIGAMLVACLAPLLAATGYFDAANALQRPYVLTLVVLGLVMALQRFTADVYGSITGQGRDAREALLPVLFGMILVALAAPALALIWGARVTDLTEIWAGFSRGFSIGDTRISPADFLTFAIIFVIGFVLTRLVQSTLRSNVLPKTRMDIGGQNAIVSGLGYIGIFLAVLLAITGAGINLSALAYVAGALSVGIGFGLQNVVSNFVSGIILLIERPISEGDWIEVGGQMGYVRDISVRSTRIETFDKTDVIVPNADLISGTVTNFTRGNTVGRLLVPVGVAYGTDTAKVDRILREIAEAHPMVLAQPPVNVFFLNFGADALEFEIRCILRDVNWVMVVKSEINHQIAERFAEEGIEIPFAQRDLWLRNPDALRGTTPSQQEPSETEPKPQAASLTSMPDASDLADHVSDSGEPDAPGTTS